MMTGDTWGMMRGFCGMDESGKGHNPLYVITKRRLGPPWNVCGRLKIEVPWLMDQAS